MKAVFHEENESIVNACPACGVNAVAGSTCGKCGTDVPRLRGVDNHQHHPLCPVNVVPDWAPCDCSKPRTIEAAMSVLRVQPNDVVVMTLPPNFTDAEKWTVLEMAQKLPKELGISRVCVVLGGIRLAIERDGQPIPPEPSVVVEVGP